MKENKIYIIYDKVTEVESAVIMGTNDNEVVRSLIFSGYFKVNRIRDTEIYNTGLTIKGMEGRVENDFDLPYEVNIEEILKELEIEITTKAEEVEPTEMKSKLKEKSKEA